MAQEFEMSMIGELSFFLGLHISQTYKGIFISQSKYLQEMLIFFGMDECAPVSTPMTTSGRISKDDDAPLVDVSHYRSMINIMLYLTVMLLCKFINGYVALFHSSSIIMDYGIPQMFYLISTSNT